jgi:ABC-type sugar transport system ATPase subunit
LQLPYYMTHSVPLFLEPIIEVRNLSLQYGNNSRLAVSNLNFQVYRGEVLALAGKSGSGKTTLLHALAGLMQPLGGSILFNNEALPGPNDKLVPGHPDILLAFQDNRLSDMLTIRQNLNVAMLAYKPAFKAAQIDMLLQILHIGHLADTRPVHISGGERQRASLARALATRPEVVLLDEPFSNLDFSLKNQIIRRLLALLKSWGCTIILVSHEPTDALSLSDRVILLQDGQLVASGTPEQLYRNPKSVYEATFFGEMNIIAAPDWKYIFSDNKIKFLAGMVWFRPSDVEISFNGPGCEASVEQVLFFGSYYRVQLILNLPEKTIEIIAYVPQIKLQTGKTVFLQVKDNQMGTLNN